MRNRKLASLAGLAAGTMLMAGTVLSFGVSTAGAQDMAMTAHPSHIHVGSCAAPGDVVAPLSNVGNGFEVDATPMAGSSMVGATSAVPVEAGVTTKVAMSLADILGSPHALVVHESAANIQNYIACGDIGGAMLGTTDLPIGLAPLNDSGYSGIAWLHDNGDNTTTVYVFLTNSSMMSGDMGTPTS